MVPSRRPPEPAPGTPRPARRRPARVPVREWAFRLSLLAYLVGASAVDSPPPADSYAAALAAAGLMGAILARPRTFGR